jgi:hypothetical protein
MFHHKKRSSKHVRFGLEDECYKFRRREPGVEQYAVSYSTSASSVSTRPYTPPPPYSYPSSPSKHHSKGNGAVWASPMLNYPSTPWDIIRHPAKTILHQLSTYREKPFIVYNPNKVSSLTLVHPSLRWWPLRIELDSKQQLTIEDFYLVLFQHLNEPLTGADLTHYGKNDVIRQTFAQRCRERRLNPSTEPIRRMDCLGFARLFNGIKETEDDPEIWELVLL